MKSPKKILIIDNIKEISPALKHKISQIAPNSEIDYKEEDKAYDLVFIMDYILRFNMKYYKPVSSAEIIHKREGLNIEIVLEGLRHYDMCEIRNGK